MTGNKELLDEKCGIKKIHGGISENGVAVRIEVMVASVKSARRCANRKRWGTCSSRKLKHAKGMSGLV